MNDPYGIEKGIALITEFGIDTVLTVFMVALNDDRTLDYVAEKLDIGQDDLLDMAEKAQDYLESNPL